MYLLTVPASSPIRTPFSVLYKAPRDVLRSRWHKHGPKYTKHTPIRALVYVCQFAAEYPKRVRV